MNPIPRARPASGLALLICLVLAVCLWASMALESPTALAAPGQPPEAAQGWTMLLVEDFESDFPGATWTLSGNPTWGKSRYRPHSGTWSGYCAAGGTGGLEPPGPYPDGMQGWMKFGPFDLSDATAAELEFHYWTRLGSGDELFWGASRSGSFFLGRKEVGNSPGWRQVVLDLDTLLLDYLGQPEVWIGFGFESDDAGNGEGAYLDDITLRIQRPPDLSMRAYLPLVIHGHTMGGEMN